MVRILGGWATSEADGTYTPRLDKDVVTRTAEGGLDYHNWERLDRRVDPWVRAGITPSPLVIDNIPYAFVAEENRYFTTYGQSAAPDNSTEFGVFIEDMVTHLVERHGYAVINTWRFRLGTEASQYRIGPAWKGEDGNGAWQGTLDTWGPGRV